MVELGFVLPTGDKYLQENAEEGHIEVALRIIEKESMSARYRKSKWNDPVDFLVFEEGALKVGNRWGAKVITYYPNKLGRKVNDAICEYRSRHFREDKVFPPAGLGLFF